MPEGVERRSRKRHTLPALGAVLFQTGIARVEGLRAGIAFHEESDKLRQVIERALERLKWTPAFPRPAG